MKWLLPITVVVVLLALFVPFQGKQMFDSEAEPALTKADPAADDDDDDADSHASRLETRNGILGIELSPETQTLSGLQMQAAEVMQHREEIHALAEVINIKPLLDLRSRYTSLQADTRISDVQLRRSREAYQRLRLLHEDNANISTSQLEEALAKLQSDEARLAAQQQQISSLRDEAIQTWGVTLTDWALTKDDSNGYLQQLIRRQEVLLNVSLGRSESMPDDTRIIYINRDNDRLNARKAYYVSAAARTEPSLQGETYYFRSRADKLRVGMRVHAWIPVSGEVVDGVHVPAEAVVWQAGQAWVYLHDGEDFFYRRALDKPVRLNQGWFIDAGQIKPGQLIVTRGAQMLLSEEYRWQIPDEDDDD